MIGSMNSPNWESGLHGHMRCFSSLLDLISNCMSAQHPQKYALMEQTLEHVTAGPLNFEPCAALATFGHHGPGKGLLGHAFMSFSICFISHLQATLSNCPCTNLHIFKLPSSTSS